MCGINGIVGHTGPDSTDLLLRMNAVTAHRGPDDVGVYHDSGGRCLLGHRRLSILDLSPAGHQPMSDPEGLVQIVFNGEIYNFRELRAEMEARGHRFRSQSDTEVLIYLYLEYGEEMLGRLNGMFAFAIWDTRTATLFGARDHFGIKPFYYTHLPDGRLLFSSEVKALLACPDVPREINLRALSDYLSFLWVGDPRTMFRGVEKLPPGSKLRWRDGRLDVASWWDPGVWELEPPAGSEEVMAEELVARLDEAVRRQLISDVPVGAFLSGGLDSSGILASMAREHRGGLRCYTIALAEGESQADGFVDDLPYARQVAAHLGVELREVKASPDIVSLWPEMVWHLDEPVADPAVINSYLIAKFAREDGTTVLLSGQGADELFAGYRWHIGPDLMRPLSRLPRPLGRAVARRARFLPGNAPGRLGGITRRARKLLIAADSDIDEAFVKYTQWTTPAERAALLAPDVRAEVMAQDSEEWTRSLLRRHPGFSPLTRRLYRDLKTFLPALNFTYTDKSSMATGLECRVPYLDIDLARFALSLPDRMKVRGLTGKFLLRKSLAGRLPPAILKRPKTGFGVPLRKWITQDLRELVDDLLSRENIERRGLFRWESVERIRLGVRQGTSDHAYLLWALITLELWHRTFLDATPSPYPPRSLPATLGAGPSPAAD
jgi:asparagine synthase (glutamine-hydrolysing)